MRVLVVGSGAREHALCHALARDPVVGSIVCAPGNAGTAALAEPRPIDPTDPLGCAALAEEVQADLTVIGPELPLVRGVADEMRRRSLAVFGPSAAAARIEGSKAFAKDVMAAAGVPTALARSHDDLATALAHLDVQQPPYVVKQDGLAAGKGVTVTTDLATARSAVRSALGRPGDRVLVEDHLDGPEVSLFAVTDGVTVLPLQPAQDFKRVGDGDSGPNTGGMGSYSPLPWAPPGLATHLLDSVLRPTVDELARRGAPFSGLLYAGLALTSTGPKVIEFNARFGDPETQALLPRLATPLGALLHRAATGELAGASLDWRPEAAVTVVVAAPGYPDAPRTGDAVTGLAEAESAALVFHAGTAEHDGAVRTAGGRVFSVTGLGTDLAAARESAYDAVSRVHFPGAHYRRDIAERAAHGEVEVPTGP